MIDAGWLFARVSLQRDTVTHVDGAEVRTPETYATVWANVRYLSGGELWKAQQVNAAVNVRVTIRYRTDVTAADRVIYNGKTFQIKAVIPDEERKSILTLECVGNA